MFNDFDPYDHLNIILNPDGSITRILNIPGCEPNPDENSGDPVLSKDCSLCFERRTWLRIYRPTRIPSNHTTVARLPIVIFFHGGIWIRCTARDVVTHNYCSRLANDLMAIVVSVDYRLAPEARLPAQYDDALDAIRWVRNQVVSVAPEGEPWLRDYADVFRCYIYGGGNGGNIAFFAAVRAVDMDLRPLNIAGIVLNQPMFGGNQRTNSELCYAADQLLPLPALDLIWQLTLPIGADRDHVYCNPMVDGPHKDKLSAIQRCLLIGFNMDPLIDRQREFAMMLAMAGVQVDARLSNIGFHGIDLIDARRMDAVVGAIKEFVG